MFLGNVQGLGFSRLKIQIWVVVAIFFNLHPCLGKIPILTNIFQRGWNRQLEMSLAFFSFCFVFFLVGRSYQKQHVCRTLQAKNYWKFPSNKNAPPIADICPPRFSSRSFPLRGPTIRKNKGVQKGMIGHEHQTTDTDTQHETGTQTKYTTLKTRSSLLVVFFHFSRCFWSIFLFRRLCFMFISGHLDM